MNIRKFVDIAVTNREAGIATCLFTGGKNARDIIALLLLEDSTNLANVEIFDADEENRPDLFTVTFDGGEIWCEPTYYPSGRIGCVETDYFSVYFDKEFRTDTPLSDYILGNTRKVVLL